MRMLSIGSRGEDVKTLQRNLILLKYPLPRYGVDGKYGTETRDMVLRFQRNNGIRVDGIFGPETKRQMDYHLNKRKKAVSPTPTPPPPPQPKPQPVIAPTPAVPMPGYNPQPEPQVAVDTTKKDDSNMMILLGVGAVALFLMMGKKKRR